MNNSHFSDYEIVKDIAYGEPSSGLKGLLYLPKTEGLKPAVIVVHGGGWVSRTGAMTSICKKLAKQGFIAFDVTYRLAPAHHHPAQVNDVTSALEWLRANSDKYKVNKESIGAWGYSAGAHLSLLVGLKPENGIRAIVAGGTPAELTAWPKSPLVTKLIGHPIESHLSAWQEASPVNHVKAQSPPVFLYHGKWDTLVEIEQMDKMRESLEKQKVPVETHKVSLLGHYGVFLISAESDHKAIDFLNRSLKSSTSIPLM